MQDPKSQEKFEPKVISSSTILILSGVILGLASSQLAGPDMLPYLIAVGLSGFLVYLILDIAANRRELAALEAEREQVEERFEKHMLSLSHSGAATSLEEASRQDKARKEKEQLSVTPEKMNDHHAVVSA